MLKIATWNVNSLRVRLPQVLRWLEREQPDLLAMQETKLSDAEFPLDGIQEAGYHALFSGEKTYNGVAILSRVEGTEVITALPGLADPQRRVLGATYSGVRVLNLYVPNGASLDSDKYGYKLSWLDALARMLPDELRVYPRLVMLGDFNIAPEEREVHDPNAWVGSVLVSEPEREAFRRLLALGICDTFRLRHEEGGAFSWWDYRAGAFRRNLGLRIDHVLASAMLCQSCRDCRIDREPRTWERPSDHAPVVAEFQI